jgi:predicted nucleic acid-binding protein
VIVVSDASPLRYLAVLDLLNLLPRLFTSVAIPRTVFDELVASQAPPEVRVWAENLPHWVEVHDDPPSLDVSLSHIDPGERAAIFLAERLHATLLLIDDEDGREAARDRGLAVTGLIGILGRAANHGYVDFDQSIVLLKRTNFRISETVIALVKESLRRK